MCDYRESREKWEWASLAPYASHSSDPSLTWRRSENDKRITDSQHRRSRPLGVHFPDSTANERQTSDIAGSLSRFKTAFQVDKERIASSTAFRRLEYKTQVFVSHEGDHFRTRLTHTIEVDETARFIAQALRLNEDLAEAIALGHDLGHTPFGHSGEKALHELIKAHWPQGEEPEGARGEQYGPAFYHNVQSVRVVDSLEKGYEWDRRPVLSAARGDDLHSPPSARGRGLDLTWAVREGILKHSSRGLRAEDVRMFGSDYLMAELDPFQPATLEGQVVEFADEITSIMHDLEDGLRSRLFALPELRKGLLDWINTKNLPALLGLTRSFGHEEDPRSRSRVRKLLELLKVMRQGSDCTMGIVLAFLRSVLVSNVVETSYWRLFKSMSGGIYQPSDSGRSIAKAGADDLIWIHMNIEKAPRAVVKGYCSEAWDVDDPARREVTVQTFRRKKGSAQPAEDPVQDAVRMWWVMKSVDPSQGRDVVIQRETGKPTSYPLGNVCLTYGGAKLMGYDENLLGLRNWLRREFIPEKLHNAPVVLRMNDKGQRFLDELFHLYHSRPSLMHHTALERYDMWDMATASPDQLQKRKAFVLRIVEHLQGMTDRYLIEEYTRLFLPGSNVAERDEMCVVDGGKPPFGRSKRAASARAKTSQTRRPA